ncbi:MAG: radical SAM protein [Verrucomicrobiota bacterium]
MKVLLAWPAVTQKEAGFDGNILPLGLGYLAANIPGKHEVGLWDGVLTHSSDNRPLLEEIKRFQPEIIGISVWIFNLSSAREMVGLIRERFPKMLIVAGGPCVSSFGTAILSWFDVNYAVAGDGERSFPLLLDLCEQAQATESNLSKIAGLIYRNAGGQAILNPPQWQSLDEVRYPDYDFIRLNEYLAAGFSNGPHQVSRKAPVMSTRGCPFDCAFCSAGLVSGRKVRLRRVESVLTEIRELYDKYGIRGFNIIDDNFTMNIAFAKTVCRGLLNMGLKGVSFACSNGIRMEFLDEELLCLMKQAGWVFVTIAPESGSERTLQNMGKNLNLEVVKAKVKLIRQAGLKAWGFFIIGFPGETLEDIRKTVRFMCRTGFDIVSILCFQPLPGTRSYEKLVMTGEIGELQGSSNVLDLSYAPVGMSTRQLRRYYLWAYFRFYTSSLQRIRNLISLYPFSRLLRYIMHLVVPGT